MDRTTLETTINTALSMIERGETNTEIHIFLSRTFGVSPTLRVQSNAFANGVRAAIYRAEIGNKSAICDWLVVAHQNTGDRSRGFHHICPARLALNTAKSLL